MKYNTIFFILFLNFVDIVKKNMPFAIKYDIITFYNYVRIRKFFFHKLCALIFE